MNSACPWIVAGVAAVLLAGCGNPTASGHKSTAAAVKTTRPVAETSLNVLELAEATFNKLKIETAPVTLRDMPRQRPYGAEAVLPTGATIIVSAPVTGTLRISSKQKVPQVGQHVSAGVTLFELTPMLSAERGALTPAERIRLAEARNTVAQTQADALGQVQQAQVQVDAAQIALERAKRLLRDQAGTARAVDEAQAQFSLAMKTLEAANKRKQLVDAIRLDEKEPATAAVDPVPLVAPMQGQVRALHVRPNEIVPAGAPLFEVMNAETLWIKVPVYVGELDEIDALQPIELQAPGGRHRETPLIARHIALPPTAVPLASTVDLYYELPNSTGAVRPGQRLTAQLMLRGKRQRLTVPWSAVMHDIYGGQWVYQQTGERKYVRRRVEVEWVRDGLAVLARGPESGDVVVTAGVAELSGTEFGFSK